MPVKSVPSEDQLFGKDLFLQEAGGDLDTLSQNGYVDFKVISGKPNLRQALTIRLRTDPGDLPQEPTYGSNLNKVASEGMKQAKELAFRYVSSSLAEEPRVKKVNSVTITETNNNTFELNAIVTLLDGDTTINLIFPFYVR